ncbi:MAG: glycosyltransferase [Bacteroidota bacterium]|nr:glycosyltransferase [Bacteroidota bacterium]
MIFLVISIFLLLPYLLLIIYYRQSWLEIETYNTDAKQSTGRTFISVIIPARNEEKNIGTCIESIVKQTYPEDLFEVIIVDDYSEDDTAKVASSYNRSNVSVINLAGFTSNNILNSYKKKAIETAITMAKGSLIVTTDADCIVRDKWLETIASYYEKTNAVFIAAPVMFFDIKDDAPFCKRFLKIFQSLDFMTLQGITGASVYKRIHNMCNGANLAYEKKVFYEAGGFEGIDNIASGDDMMLMHKIQKLYPDRMGYLKSRDATVKTQAADSARKFLNQRIRWASKADKYPDIKITAVLILVYLLNLWIIVLAIVSFFYNDIFYLLVFSFFTKTFVELYFLYPVAHFFKNKKLLWWFIPAEPFHIIYTLFAGWLGKFGSYTWKGRRVK